jgi:hypothetical protein
LHRQVGGLFTIENATDIDADDAVLISGLAP